MRCPNKISQSALGLLLLSATISKISSAGRCPDEQVQHVISETRELRCCYPCMVDIGNEFVMCSVNGGNDTQRPCGPGLIQPDHTSSEHEPECISEMESLNCNSYDTKIVQDGASKKCICNLDAGFCGLDPLLCTQISSKKCTAGYKVDQSCICVLSSPLQPMTQDRTEVTKNTMQVVSITLSQLPKEEKPWTDGKTIQDSFNRGEHDVNNTVNNDLSSNSNNNVSIIIPSVLAPCILVLLGLLLYFTCRWRKSDIRHSAAYNPLHKGQRNDTEAGIRDEELCTQILRHHNSKVPVQSSSTSSIENYYEVLTYEGTAKGPLIAVVPPIKQARERSTTPACPALDTSARAQDPANLISVHSVEELPGPVFDNNVPYTPLCPESLESSGMDMTYGEIIRVPQSSESSVTQQAVLSSELVQSREVSLTQERREETPAGAATAKRASDFRHDTNVKEYGTSPGPIHELTKGKNTTFHGAGKVRAELPVNVPCLEGSTKRDSEDTELKAQETAVKCLQRTGVVTDGIDMPFTNELMARTDRASYTSVLDLSNVVSDPSGVCSEDSGERNEETNCQNPLPSNSFEALGIPNLPSFMSADSLVKTDSDEDEKYE